MSVGGTVIEVIDCDWKNRVWVNTKDRRDECAIYIERTPAALAISPGDGFWWQSAHAMWTPKNAKGKAYTKTDMKLNRIGFSGVSRPTSKERNQP